MSKINTKIQLEKAINLGIKHWLNLESCYKGISCPFDTIEDSDICNIVCTKLFPRRNIIHCPCSKFGHDFVVKKISKLMKDGGFKID